MTGSAASPYDELPAAEIPRCTIPTPHSHSSFDDPIICPLRGDEEPDDGEL